LGVPANSRGRKDGVAGARAPHRVDKPTTVVPGLQRTTERVYDTRDERRQSGVALDTRDVPQRILNGIGCPEAVDVEYGNVDQSATRPVNACDRLRQWYATGRRYGTPRTADETSRLD